MAGQQRRSIATGSQLPDFTKMTRAILLDLTRNSSQSFTDVQITRDLANVILSLNTKNRPMRETRIKTFMEILAGERWVNTGEPVIISQDGPLTEAQHRLTAIVRSGITATMDIRVGIHRAAFAVTGTGATRTVSDALSLLGVSNPTNVASTIKLALAYAEGLPGAYHWRVGTDLVVKAAERWPDIKDAPRFLINNSAGRHFVNAASGVLTWLGRRSAGDEAVREFLQLVCSPTTPMRSPARMLRERLLNDLELRMGQRDQVIEKLAIYIIAWNAWRGHANLSKLRWHRTDPFPKVGGVVL